MSLYESWISSGMVSLRGLCQDVSLDPVMTGPVKLDMLADCMIRGGWPANQGIPIEYAAYLPKQYINAIIDDVFRLDGIRRDKHNMGLLLRSLARNESTTATNRRLTDDIRKWILRIYLWRQQLSILMCSAVFILLITRDHSEAG